MPNIPIQVVTNINLALDQQFKFISFLEHAVSQFIQAEVVTIDPENQIVFYQSTERARHSVRKIHYDYLVVALGNLLAYYTMEGFSENGHSVTDVFLGNRLRNYLHKEYKGVPRGIECNDGTTPEVENTILFPDWQAHVFLKELTFTDDMGFVVTDLYRRNPNCQNIFAVGDAACVTVLK